MSSDQICRYLSVILSLALLARNFFFSSVIWTSVFDYHSCNVFVANVYNVTVASVSFQSIDSFMHVNPFITNKGLAMVFNPTLEHITTTLTLPLYYTGLTDLAKVSQMGGAFKTYTLERDYTIELDIDMGPRNITWFLIQ